MYLLQVTDKDDGGGGVILEMNVSVFFPPGFLSFPCAAYSDTFICQRFLF